MPKVKFRFLIGERVTTARVLRVAARIVPEPANICRWQAFVPKLETEAGDYEAYRLTYVGGDKWQCTDVCDLPKPAPFDTAEVHRIVVDWITRGGDPGATLRALYSIINRGSSLE